MEKTHIRTEKKKLLIPVAVAAAVLSAVLIVLAIHKITRVHYAVDFGFCDIKSDLDADGDGIDDYTDIMRGALAYIAPAVLLVSALLTAGYLFTPIIRGFFPGEGYALGEPIREPRAMIVPLLFLAAVCGLLGFVSGPVTSVMEAIAGGMM